MIGADDVQHSIDAITASQGKIPPGATLSLEAWHRKQRIELRETSAFFNRRVADVALDVHSRGITNAQVIAHGIALEAFLFGVVSARRELAGIGLLVVDGRQGGDDHFRISPRLLELQ